MMLATAQMLSMSVMGLAQSSGFTIVPVVKRGDPSPDGGRFFDCDLCLGHVYGSRALNNRGEVAVYANIKDGCFVSDFLISVERKTLLANSCEETGLGKIFGVGNTNTNDAGQAVFGASWSKDGRIDGGIVYYSQGQLTKIVALGDPTPVGTFFRGCGFSEPSINNHGDVAFGSCSDDGNGLSLDGIFSYSGGQVHKVVTYGDPSPLGGFLALNFLPAITPILNDNGDVLFHGGSIIDINIKEKFGLFVSTANGVRKIVVDGDPMPNNTIVFPGSLGIGDLNNKDEVAFTVKLQGSADTGIFLSSGGTISKIVARGIRLQWAARSQHLKIPT